MSPQVKTQPLSTLGAKKILVKADRGQPDDREKRGPARHGQKCDFGGPKIKDYQRPAWKLIQEDREGNQSERRGQATRTQERAGKLSQS